MRSNRALASVSIALAMGGSACLSLSARAADERKEEAKPADAKKDSSAPAEPKARPTETAPAGTTNLNVDNTRNFYEVLEDVLGDFEFDIKNGDVQGLKDLAVRNIAVSENIPASFKQHLELAITERVLKHAHTRVLQCLPCRARRTTLNGDQVVITSAETNPVELARIAKLSGIMNMMDVAFSYQPTGMVLSMYIVDPESGSIIWSRSYNSETSRAAAFRRGVDYAQIDEARRKITYDPSVQYRGAVYYLFERNYSTYTGCLAFGLRIVERYDNRRKEVGFELNYIKDVSTFVNKEADTTTNLYAGFNLTLLFMNTFNFIGNEENFHRIRGNFFFGIGGTFTSGYLGGLVRTGWEWRLAKHWAINLVLGFRPPATAFLPGTTAKSVMGVEVGGGIAGYF